MANDYSQQAACSGAAPFEQGQMPEVTFSTFILSLCSSAMVQLGDLAEPETGQHTQNLLMAKHTIDILDMLKAKTTACLTEAELGLLDNILHDLRLRYVDKTRNAA
jgi:hypothetical protein